MHDLRELRAEADRCEQAMGMTRDNALRRRFAARMLEFTALAAALEQRRENANKRNARSKQRSISTILSE
jgi:hypothetical protein